MPSLYSLGFAPRCGEPAPKRGLSHCIRDHNHTGGHVYWTQTRTTLDFYDTFGKVLVHCDIAPGALITEDEASALWAYLEELKEQRRREAEQEGEGSD